MNKETEQILTRIQSRGKTIQKLWEANRKDLDRLKEIKEDSNVSEITNHQTVQNERIRNDPEEQTS